MHVYMAYKGNKNRIVPEGYEEAPITIEDRQLGMRFHADMLNRLWFLGITLALCAAFCATFIQSWIPNL